MKGFTKKGLMRWFAASFLGCGALAVALLAGCSGSDFQDDGLNTSSAGANINFTGFYARAGGGKIVSNTTGAPITSLTIHQTGNVIDAVDNNGSKYHGKTGVPNSFVPVGAGQITNSQRVAESQVVMEGFDNTSGKKVEIVGVFSVVAVQDIFSSTSTQGHNVSTSQSQTGSSTTGQSVVTVIITPNSTNTFSTGQSSGESGSRTETSTSSGTVTQTFGLTRGNSQYELRGTWIEEGGATGTISATSPGGAGTIITTSSQ